MLMGLAALSAFVVPARFTTPVREPFQGLFWPVARPTRAITGWVDRRYRPAESTDEASPAQPRSSDAIRTENRDLRAGLAALQVKFDLLSRINADRELVGDIRPMCRPATVSGADASGFRDAVTVSGVGREAEDRPVVQGNRLVGRVQSAGVTGASVRLLSDQGFVFTARVMHYADGRAVPVGDLNPWVQGLGHGTMVIRSPITMRQVAELHIAVGDPVVLADGKWPDNVQGFTAGHVSKIRPQAAAPLYAELEVEPAVRKADLREVMVVVRGPATATKTGDGG